MDERLGLEDLHAAFLHHVAEHVGANSGPAGCSWRPVPAGEITQRVRLPGDRVDGLEPDSWRHVHRRFHGRHLLRQVQVSAPSRRTCPRWSPRSWPPGRSDDPSGWDMASATAEARAEPGTATQAPARRLCRRRATEPADVPMITSAAARSMPRPAPAIRPVSQATPATPPPPRISARLSMTSLYTNPAHRLEMARYRQHTAVQPRDLPLEDAAGAIASASQPYRPVSVAAYTPARYARPVAGRVFDQLVWEGGADQRASRLSTFPQPRSFTPVQRDDQRIYRNHPQAYAQGVTIAG